MEKSISKKQLFNELGAIVSVKTMQSRSGASLSPQQVVITLEHGSVFYSYGKLIGAYKYGGTLYLTDYHDYSNTTSYYCGRWCGWNTQERRKGLNKGDVISLID